MDNMFWYIYENYTYCDQYEYVLNVGAAKTLKYYSISGNGEYVDKMKKCIMIIVYKGATHNYRQSEFDEFVSLYETWWGNVVNNIESTKNIYDMGSLLDRNINPEAFIGIDKNDDTIISRNVEVVTGSEGMGEYDVAYVCNIPPSCEYNGSSTEETYYKASYMCVKSITLPANSGTFKYIMKYKDGSDSTSSTTRPPRPGGNPNTGA